MKTLYKTLMTLAAGLAFASVVSAQTVNPEVYQEQHGVGYNKYLKSTTPNSDGTYTLRIESFVTGNVKKLAVPTDFVLVLDVSGSMLFDHRYADTTLPVRIAISTNDSRAASHPLKLVEDEGIGGQTEGKKICYFSFNHGYSAGTIGTVKTSGDDKTSWRFFEYVNTSGTTVVPSATRYVKYSSDTYFYRIFGEIVTKDSKKYYELYINRRYQDSNGTWKTQKRYIHINTSTHTLATQTTPWYEATSPEQIIFASKLAGTSVSNVTLYRPQQRRDALKRGLTSFVNKIQAENAKDQWATGVKKHQIAEAVFGEGYHYSSDPDNITPVTTKSNKAKVIQAFTEVTAANKAGMASLVDDRVLWRSGTWINQGTHLALKLLQNLQTQTNMGPLNTSNGVNRNKVVIVFTDGEPSSYSEDSPGSYIPPGSTTTYTVWGTSGTAFMTCQEGYTIKRPRTTYSGTQVNGKIYTIDLSAEPNSSTFLKHLSSNFADGRVKTSPKSSYQGPWANVQYRQTDATTSGYYFDASNIDMSTIFETIAGATTGENTTSEMVAVDVMSDSFVMPDNITDAGKVKFYTAQCIGTKTISGKTYLAFAKEIAAPSRGNITNLWVSYEDANHNTQWKNVGSGGDGTLKDIDGTTAAPKISCVISDDKKQITVKGFDFADLWCGLDAAHTNTRHTVATTDPNYGNQKDGYRGFKLIIEFPIRVEDGAVGGPNVPTNNMSLSGLFHADTGGSATGSPIVNYPLPDLDIPVTLVIEKEGLKSGESASFTVQRRLASSSSSTWSDYNQFVLTGNGSANPSVTIRDLDPKYYYRIKEDGWSWAYTRDTHVPTTESSELENPIIFTNTAKTDTPKHAEAKATNTMKNN